MAGSRRPSFLKRQKEQKRLARAQEKREARLARKRGQVAGEDGVAELMESAEVDSLDQAEPDAPKPEEAAQPDE